MFALFFSLYMAMFSGNWQNIAYGNIFNQTTNSHHINLVTAFNEIGKLITSIFNDGGNPVTDLGDSMINNASIIYVVSFVLALITSIGIVVVATKGIKKLFTVFFYGVR